MKPLSEIEFEVLRGSALGETYAETGRRIFITEKSVSNVATRIMRKLDAKTMPHAVHLAYQFGLLRRERHGDHAGYAAHTRRGETPCDACTEGELEYRAQRRQMRRQTAADGLQALPVAPLEPQQAREGAWTPVSRPNSASATPRPQRPQNGAQSLNAAPPARKRTA